MKLPIVFIFGFILVVVSLITTAADGKQRIISGTDAQRGQFPYMVSVQKNGTHHCGGTIVSTTWIVSAAHCFNKSHDPKDLIVVAGMLKQGEEHPDLQISTVLNVIIHPDFVHIPWVHIDNDISLLKLATPLIFTKAVQPASIPKKDDVFFGYAWLSGWGTYKWPLGQIKPKTLQYLEMSLISNEECTKVRTKLQAMPDYEIMESMICTVARTLVSSACKGDSGGPLVQDGILIGVVSFGDFRCGIGLENVPIPNVFTRVTSYYNFIRKYVENI